MKLECRTRSSISIHWSLYFLGISFISLPTISWEGKKKTKTWGSSTAKTSNLAACCWLCLPAMECLFCSTATTYCWNHTDESRETTTEFMHLEPKTVQKRFAELKATAEGIWSILWDCHFSQTFFLFVLNCTSQSNPSLIYTILISAAFRLRRYWEQSFNQERQVSDDNRLLEHMMCN